MLPRAAIFDLDGTLIDSAASHAASWRVLAAELGLTLPADWFLHTFGRANRDIIPEMLGGAVPDAEIQRLSDRKEALYRELAAETLQPFPGALELLAALQREGWGLAIGSSTPRANLAFALPLLGLDQYIQTTVGMEDVSRHKPEPDTFLACAADLEVAPERCLVFEDAPAGILAAVRGGMHGIAVTTHHPAERFGEATAIRDGLWSISAADCAGWLGD
ncbi:MAG: HAD family phosphatase [Fimbriimonadaceae bacterium]|nr:HAD family phosphatase [Fimbriimonadaceae bacterium]